VKAALQRVKYHIFAGLILSGAAGLAIYGLEARDIKAETARVTAEQVGEIEERIALAYAELESTTALISQAHPSIAVLNDYINGLALSKSRSVPWLWAYVATDSDAAALQAEIRSQRSMEAFTVKKAPGSSTLLAPVVFVTGSIEARIIGTDILSQPELARLAAEAANPATRQLREPLVPLAFQGLPPDTVYMTRYVLPARNHPTGMDRPSLILRGLTAANLTRSAQLKDGQALRLFDKSVDPPRPLMQIGNGPATDDWLLPAEFTVGEHKFGVSLSMPQDHTRPGWWLLVTVGGVLLTGLYATLRSGFIVGARATQLGSILNSTEQRLAETQRREIAFFENAGTANCETDFATGQLVRVNESLCNMLGYTPEELVGRSFNEITHPDDIGLVRAQLFDDNGEPKSRLQFEKRYVRKDGSAMWCLVNSRLYFDGSGKPQSYMTVIINIEDRKRDEATKTLLTRELAHRVRNTVQLTSSLARQTAASAKTIKDYDTKFHRRLSALSAAQDILFDRNWMSAPLSRIAQAIVKPFLPEDRKQGELLVNLPDVELPTQQAQTIAIALHELASNSSKYGALSDGGTVHVVGVLLDLDEDGTRTLHLKWDEKSTKPIRKPRRSGFGSRMLMSAMPEQFGGRAKSTWRRSGFLYEAWLKIPEA
jgi:PAS domain S-box-containing protein